MGGSLCAEADKTEEGGERWPAAAVGCEGGIPAPRLNPTNQS